MKTPVSERICLYCSDGTIEDEMHFLLDCMFYIDERCKLIEACTEHIPGFETMEPKDKFINIMSLNYPTVTRPLGRFIYDCLKKRNDVSTQM